MSIRITLCPICGKQTGMYESGRGDSIAASKCECRPTDPTPAPSPREAMAKAMQAELDKHHDWDDAPPGRPVSGCGHHRLADGDFLKMADAGLAALAATGDAPLAAEEYKDLLASALQRGWERYLELFGVPPNGTGRQIRAMLEFADITAYTALAAQLAAARAERDALRARVAELEGALAFYADETNYCDGAPGHYIEVSYADGGGYEFREDDGDIARRVLAAYDKEGT